MKNFLSTLKGKIIAGACTLAVIAAAVAIGVSLNRGYRTICVDDLNGVTTVTALETVSEVFKGQNLQSGSAVAVGENADLTLALDTDKHVYAKELTRFQLEASGAAGKDSKTLIKLEKGSVLSRIDEKLQANESYVVESPNALMAVRGTTFTVTVFYDENGVCHTIVEVAEGTVEMTERDENGNLTGEVWTIGAGESIEVTEDELSAENVPETTTAVSEETTVTTTATTTEETTTVSEETETTVPEFAEEEELEDVTEATTAVTTAAPVTTTAPVTTKKTTTTKAAKEEFITIKGEQYSTLLISLNLNNMDLTNEDIKPLEKMVNLKTLFLDQNKISDLSALSGLTDLTYLSLYYNNISDLSALSGLIKLESLGLGNNPINDISALSRLTNLKNLYFVNNNISDISTLRKLTKLECLYLSFTQTSDISALSGLTNLTTLSLYFNQINDISALSELTNLTWLDLGNNQISDISALRKLTKLETLSVGGNQISNISALKKLTKLESVNLGSNPISKKDIEDLRKALPKCSIN